MNLADYETVKQAALRLGLHQQQVRLYARQGRIPGLQWFGTHAMIPKDWVPVRRKSGRKPRAAATQAT